MQDTLSLLRHNTAQMAKTWKSDGTISDYGDAKFFKLDEWSVATIRELSALLTRIQSDPFTCLIRGKHVGPELAAQRDPEFRPGRVRRALDYFDDQPLHTVCLDVDDFEPLGADPVTDPATAVDEFVLTMLPDEFRGASYHWQLSNSAGHHTKGGQLRCHIWFWLDQPMTSAQLTAWAKAVDLPADKALFRTVQVHYTALPVFEEGQQDPCPVRSGFVEGLLGDEVLLVVDEALLAAAVARTGGRGQRMREVASDDRIAQVLAERGMVKSQRTDGGLNIECPNAAQHTSDSVESATVYYPPNTGGFAKGDFKCLHAHCAEMTRGMFLSLLGIDEVMDEFETLPGAGGGEGGADEPAATRKGIPEAQHLTTDQANAGRIVGRFSKRLIVVAGQWYAWSGVRWEKDEGEVYRYACRLSKIIHAEADQWLAKPARDDDERELNAAVADALKKWALKSEMKSAIEAAVGLAKKMLAVAEDQIDRNPWLLNCANGTVDLRTGALGAHNPDDYITKLVPIEYDPEARSDVWEDTVARVTLESEMGTKPLASFLQRWFGYCATGSTREQAFVVHYGQGSNGKSTILDTVAEALGDYAATAAPGLLVGNGKDRHPTEIADLFGRRMVTSHETSDGGHLKEDIVKQLTGSDKVKARFMRADFFEFDPTHKLQLLTNHKPIIKGQDHGIWRRVLLVPYMAKFTTIEEVRAGRGQYVKDTSIAERLKAEMAGVLTWVVEGARQWFQDGLQPPDTVLAASKDYQTEQDRVLQFVNECCELGAGREEVFADGHDGLFPAYRRWCADAGFFALTKNRFMHELERVVPTFKQSQKQRTTDMGTRKKLQVISGIKLLSDTDGDFD